MQNTVVIGEFDGATSLESLRSTAEEIAAKQAGVSRVDCYRRTDGSEQYDHWLITELGDAQHLADATGAMTTAAAEVRAYHEVFRMSRDRWGIAHQRSGSREVDSLPASLLTIYLPCPEGRSAEWNEWYDCHHMPTVFSLAAGLTIGHRYAPVMRVPNDEYLVLYEFASEEELQAFQTGGTPDAKKAEYLERWGVRNTRRAFALEFAVAP
jgi:hypothetical protein